MLSLDDFLKTHGRAAERIARGDDEIFNESLALPFQQYVSDFNGTGDIKAYVLMRMRFSVLKILYRRDKFERKYGTPLEFDPIAPTETQDEHAERLLALRQAIDNLKEEDERQVLMLWANGYTQQQISSEVSECIRNVRRKLRSALIQISRELGHEISFE